ncbi:MAG TPA: PQQ-binding-like beta-propeller repeat protein, partial [Labilithrix sp.]|nr:PQQ-binding-like beta-propeller repeat protein [Labilithrix sp.]
GSWPLRGGCTTRAGWSSSPGPQTGAVAFRAPLEGGESAPAYASGIVWVGTDNGSVVALSTTGSVLWEARTGAPVRSSPAIAASGNVIVGNESGVLYAFTAENGEPFADAGPATYPSPKVVFFLFVGPMVASPVIGADGTIYVGTTEGKLVAVSSDGSGVKWSASTNDTLGSSPALGQDGTIYVGSSDGNLYAFSPDGGAKWALALGAAVSGSPAVGGDGTVYIGTSHGNLNAVRPDGTLRWSYATDGEIRGTPAVYAGVVYVGSEDKRLHAISTLEGTAYWRYATQGAVGTPVIGPDGMVYVGSADSRIYAISPRGSLVFAVSAKGKVTSAPAISPGPLLYVATDSALVAVGP